MDDGKKSFTKPPRLR